MTQMTRDGTMMISADDRHALKERVRQFLTIEDFTDADIEVVRRAKPSKESEAFNQEINL